MAGILGTTRIQSIIGKVVPRALSYAVMLHKRTPGYDAYGAQDNTFTDYTLQGLDLGTKAARRFQEAVPDGATAILLVQHLAPAAPAIGDEVTCRAVRYQILAVEQDPAQATWECLARAA